MKGDVPSYHGGNFWCFLVKDILQNSDQIERLVVGSVYSESDKKTEEAPSLTCMVNVSA